ncbi:MAG: hypothetical protein HDS65_01105, partial [Bacteroidales bacterium]|nr:hypothetical protein [Bacteroidales bacterium]
MPGWLTSLRWRPQDADSWQSLRPIPPMLPTYPIPSYAHFPAPRHIPAHIPQTAYYLRGIMSRRFLDITAEFARWFGRSLCWWERNIIFTLERQR